MWYTLVLTAELGTGHSGTSPGSEHLGQQQAYRLNISVQYCAFLSEGDYVSDSAVCLLICLLVGLFTSTTIQKVTDFSSDFFGSGRQWNTKH